MKLSKAQEKVLQVLDAMEYKDWYSAVDLECSLATLYALRNKGMIRIQYNGLRGIDSARFNIQCQIIKE